MSEPPNPDDVPEEEPSEITKGMRESPEGDPRVLFLINAVLSAILSYTVLYLSEFVGITELTIQRFLAFMLIIMLITHLITRP